MSACVRCRTEPAAEATFRAQAAVLIVRYPQVARGPFCRDCGLAHFRAFTTLTIWRGWWGIFAVLAPWIIGANLVNRAKVMDLPRQYVAEAGPPAPPSPLAVAVAQGRVDRPPRPLDPGRPIWLRWRFIGVLIPFAVIAVCAYGWRSATDESVTLPDQTPRVGACVDVLETSAPMYVVSCAHRHNGRITAIVRDATTCPDDTWYVDRALDASDNAWFVCVKGD